MIGVEVNGYYLDMYPNATLSYTLNNSVFSSSDTSQLPGSYTFPFQVPASPMNQRLLGHPGIINRATGLSDKAAAIYFQGQQLFSGTLGYESANDREISLYVVANQVRDLKEVKLPELNLGGIREIGNDAAMLSHAKETADDPLGFDYIFFPVMNRKFITAFPKTYIQNQYDSVNEEFVVSQSNPALMPFVRVDYLISRIMAITGYSFRNEFQVSEELRKMVLYNNYSIFNADNFQTYIRLNDHVPDITAAEFLKRICATFCLGFFTDTFSKVIRLIPLQRLLQAQTKTDWTARTHDAYNVPLQKTEIPAGFNYTLEGGDDIFEFLKKLQKPDESITVQNVDDMLGEPEGYYYVVATGSWWKNEPFGRTHWVYADFGYMPEEDNNSVKTRGRAKPRIEPAIPPVFDLHDYLNTANYTNTMIPVVDTPGTVVYNDNTDTTINLVAQRTPVPVRLAIYRGYVLDSQASTYPLGSGIRYGPLGQVLGQHSLRWDGPDGVYNQWWSKWHAMLSGKQVTRKVNLTARDLATFSFAEKVRIENMDYFVKSIRVNLTMRGMSPCEVSMLSVV